jgi:hypothetical protein
MKLARLLVLGATVSLVALVACSSSDDGSGGAASSCSSAKKIADDCKANAKPSDGGVSITVDFDEAKCESAGDQGKQAADCIVQHKDNCDCVAQCSITGSCT